MGPFLDSALCSSVGPSAGSSGSSPSLSSSVCLSLSELFCRLYFSLWQPLLHYLLLITEGNPSAERLSRGLRSTFLLTFPKLVYPGCILRESRMVILLSSLVDESSMGDELLMVPHTGTHFMPLVAGS